MVIIISNAGSFLVEVASPLSIFYHGPPNILWYTILHGFFTVLAIKEIWSIFGVLVKGSSNELRIGRIILWHLVENFEDLLKTIRLIIFPCIQDLWGRVIGNRNDRINTCGWIRVFTSCILAFLLFLIDIGLIVLSAPSLKSVDASTVQPLIWSNSAPIRTLRRKADVLQGSFSRTVILSSILNDVEFVQQPSLSLERTYFDDFNRSFGAKLPPYTGKFFECDASEKWRITCRIYCKNKLYQYKLRLDISVRDIGKEKVEGDSFFVSTENITVASNSINPLQKYVDALRDQLNINATVGYYKGERFELNSVTQPPEKSVLLSSGHEVLTHDAIATLFLSTIDIKAGQRGTRVFRRKQGQRKTERIELFGKIAVSQRPYVPLKGTLVMYLVLALVSGCLQWSCHAIQRAKELNVILEFMALPFERCMFNADAAPLRIERSRTTIPSSLHIHNNIMTAVGSNHRSEQVELEHKGYLPASIVVKIAQYLRECEDSEQFLSKWGIMDCR